MHAPHPDWMVPDWPLPPGVSAMCSTRAGGVSAPPYDHLNLGDHVGDATAAVSLNRQRWAQGLGARPVFLNQVHGSHVVTLHPGIPDGTLADGCVSTAAGLACTIMVADCLPVLFCQDDGAVVAAAHAGWRGLAGAAGQTGILEAVFESFSLAASVNISSAATKLIANKTLVWLGPCIGPQAFEVGSEVRTAFVQADCQADRHFVACGQGKYLADLAGLARQRLSGLGIERIYGNDSSLAWCTHSNPLRFFSHRRDSARLGGSGRMAAAIWKS